LGVMSPMEYLNAQSVDRVGTYNDVVNRTSSHVESTYELFIDHYAMFAVLFISTANT